MCWWVAWRCGRGDLGVIGRLLLAGVAAMGLVAGAQAADLPVPGPSYYPGVMMPVPYYNWGGFYVGGNAGGVWTTQSNALLINDVTGASESLLSTSSSNAGGGFQLGANYFIAPSFLVGVEGDFDALLNKTTTNSPAGDNQRVTKNEFVSTARLRLGLTSDRLLYYVTGGGALGETANTRSQLAGVVPIVPVPPGTIETVNVMRYGFTFGTGVEWAVTSSWLARIEYLYTRLDGVTYTFPLAQRTVQTPFEAINMVRLGVSYKFGGGDPIPPLNP